jgi:uncharacterized protein GlcG (DUF336 family)
MSTTHKTLQLPDARRILAAATQKAEDLHQPMNIAVVCAGGHLLAFERMENAWLGSIDIAIDKAWTARAFDTETEALAKLSQPNEPLFGIHTTNNGRVIIFPGGIPIRQDGKVVGAIGVSGGTAEQDQAIAKAGAAAF